MKFEDRITADAEEDVRWFIRTYGLDNSTVRLWRSLADPHMERRGYRWSSSMWYKLHPMKEGTELICFSIGLRGIDLYATPLWHPLVINEMKEIRCERDISVQIARGRDIFVNYSDDRSRRPDHAKYSDDWCHFSRSRMKKPEVQEYIHTAIEHYLDWVEKDTVVGCREIYEELNLFQILKRYNTSINTLFYYDVYEKDYDAAIFKIHREQKRELGRQLIAQYSKEVHQLGNALIFDFNKIESEEEQTRKLAEIKRMVQLHRGAPEYVASNFGNNPHIYNYEKNRIQAEFGYWWNKKLNGFSDKELDEVTDIRDLEPRNEDFLQEELAACERRDDVWWEEWRRAEEEKTLKKLREQFGADV